MGLLVALVVVCVFIGIVYVILTKIPFPPEWRWLVWVVFGLIIVFLILNYLPAGLLPKGRFG